MTAPPVSPAPKPPVGSRRLRFVFAVLALVVAGALIAEIAVRILHLGPPVYTPRRFIANGRSGIPWTTIKGGKLLGYQPNSVFTAEYDPSGDLRGYMGPLATIRYEINGDGLRGPAINPAHTRNDYRVLCLGDSLTFGEGVRFEDTYPARLQKLLSDCHPGRHVDVINAGIQAYGTAEEAALFLLRGEKYHPNVLTLQFFLNDAMPVAETIRVNDAAMRTAEVSWLGRCSRIAEIIERSRQSTKLQSAYFEEIRRSFDSEEWNRCKRSIAGLNRSATGMGCRFVVIVFPVLVDLDGQYPFADIHQKIAQACKESGCEFIDMLETYRGRKAADLWVHPTDQHPNEVAHRLAAEAIAAKLCNAG